MSLRNISEIVIIHQQFEPSMWLVQEDRVGYVEVIKEFSVYVETEYILCQLVDMEDV